MLGERTQRVDVAAHPVGCLKKTLQNPIGSPTNHVAGMIAFADRSSTRK
jgi:hypothetical protein